MIGLEGLIEPLPQTLKLTPEALEEVKTLLIDETVFAALLSRLLAVLPTFDKILFGNEVIVEPTETALETTLLSDEVMLEKIDID